MMNDDRYHVMGQMVEAVALLSSSLHTYTLLPEIRSNLVMATKDAKTPDDIAGIPGRLIAVFRKDHSSCLSGMGCFKIYCSDPVGGEENKAGDP
jgi:predicted fused transcriptional regulator/phosphomethylpyrimidine kinase